MAIPRNLANFAPKLDSSGNPTFTAPTVFSAGTAGAPSITFTGNTNTGIFSPAGDTIAFSEGGAEAMRLTSSGYLLIGTSTSNANYGVPLLQLDNGSGPEFSMRRATAADGSTVGFMTGYSTHGLIGGVSFITDGAQTASSTPGAIRFLTQASGGTGGPSERMRITSNGTLGLNNSNPFSSSQYFTFSGNSWGGGNGSGVNGSSKTQVLWEGFSLDNAGSVNPVGFTLSGGGGGVARGFIIGSYGAGRSTTRDSFFFTSNTGNSPHNNGLAAPAAGVYRGALDATTYTPTTSFPFLYGNGGITSFGVYDNYTSEYDGTSKAGIQVRLSGTYGGGSPGAWGGACYTAYINTNFGSGSAGTNFGYRASISNAGSGSNWAFYADAGDAAKPGGGSWTSTSDARVKNVIGQYGSGLSQVVQINPVKFTYNGKGGHLADGKEYIGVIAQEIQPHFPEMVSTRFDKLNESDEEYTEILMVDNSSLVYALVNAVKELKSELDAVKSELAVLKGN